MLSIKRALRFRATDVLWVVFWFWLLPWVLAAGQEAGDGACVSRDSMSAQFLRAQAWCLDGVDPKDKRDWFGWRNTIFTRCNQELIRDYADEHRWMPSWEYFGEKPPPVSWRDNHMQ